MLPKKLTHPLTLLLIIIAVAIVLNRDELFGESQPQARHTPVFTPTAGGSEPSVRQEPAETPSAAAKAEIAPTTTAGDSPHNSVSGAQVPTEPAASVVAPELSGSDTSAQEVWRTARLAAWEGRFQDSLAAYERLIAAEPENADAHGEMGNVHLQLGNGRKAVDAYEQSAMLWHEAEDSMRAWHLQRIVSGFDWERGQALGKILVGNGSK